MSMTFTFEERLQALEDLLEIATDTELQAKIEQEIDYLWYCKDIDKIAVEEIGPEVKEKVKKALSTKEYKS